MFERLVLVALDRSLTPSAQSQDARSRTDTAAQLQRLDASLERVSQLLELQVSQTDAMLAMQHVALQTLQAQRLQDKVDGLSAALDAQGEHLAYLAHEVRSQEEAAEEPGLARAQRESQAQSLEYYRKALRAARDELQEEELALAEAQRDLTRCKEDLHGWQARVDRFLSLRGY